MKKTDAILFIDNMKERKTFKIRQGVEEAIIDVKSFSTGIAVISFLGDRSLKSQVKMMIGCFQSMSNIEGSIQKFFGTTETLKEIRLLFDNVVIKITKKDKDVIKLYKQFSTIKAEQTKEQARLRAKEQEELERFEKRLQFRNKTMTKGQKLKRRRRKMKWLRRRTRK